MCSLGTFIFHTPPLALLSSSLQGNQKTFLQLRRPQTWRLTWSWIVTVLLPQRFSFSSHHMVTTPQWQSGNTGYVVVNSPKVLLQPHSEQKTQVVLLTALTRRTDYRSITDTFSKLFYHQVNFKLIVAAPFYPYKACHVWTAQKG